MLIGPSAPQPDVHQSGERITEAQPGSLICERCGFALPHTETGRLPDCPNCAGTSFRAGSLFERPTIDAEAIRGPATAPEWLGEARAELEGPGSHLAFEDGDGAIAVVRLAEGWTRIGRSVSADIRLDDPTVSRRHALVVVGEDRGLKALDDRSLNGLFVNGERVDWTSLADGDELEIGRYRLYVLIA
jgi:hypothetical protein